MRAWQVAILLITELYKICDQLLPSEKFNLIDQIKRAGLSVSNNIAEGAARKSTAERKRFYEISRSSVVEIDNCFEVIIALKMLDREKLKVAEHLVEEDFKLLTAMLQN